MTTTSSLNFDDIFSRTGVLGHELSEKLKSMGGKMVQMQGYLAPVASGALVLTRKPAARGSEGGTDHGWPDDAVFVLPADGSAEFEPGVLTEVEGILEHGSEPIAGTDVNSFVRLRDARLRAV